MGADRQTARAPQAQAKLQELTGDLPPTRAVWAAPGSTADPITDAFARQLDPPRRLPKVPEWERIVTEMQTVAEMVVRGRMTIDEAVHEMDRRADRCSKSAAGCWRDEA